MNEGDADSNGADGAPDARAERGARQEPIGEDFAGLKMTDILALPDPVREIVNWMLRKREVGLEDVMARLHQDEAAAQATLQRLVDRGYVWEARGEGGTRYRLRLAPAPKRPSSMPDF